MNILIIENEVYLAQKIVSRLLDDGHLCDFIESTNINMEKRLRYCFNYLRLCPLPNAKK